MAGRRGKGALGGAFAILLVLIQAGPALGAGSVSGTVLGTGGAPVQGICVSAEPALLPDPSPPSTTTGPSGSYVLSGVPAGLHAVRFRDCRPGGDYVSESFPGVVDPAGAALVRVQNSLTTTGINASLEEGGTIAGTITDGVSGLAGACVTATPTAPGNAGTAITAGDGGYAITGLAPGPHRVRFESCDLLLQQPDGVFATEWHPGTSDPAAATTVTVTAGLTSAGVGTALEAASHITGSVSDSSPAAVAGVCVSARRSGTTVARAKTGAGGAYDLGGLRAAASYKLLFAPGCGPDPQPNLAPRWYDGATSEGAADPVLPGATADATLPAGAVVSGVVDDGANGLGGICVRAFAAGDPSTPLALATTDGTGAYALTGLATGSVKLSFVDCSASPSRAQEWNGNAASFAAASSVALTEGSTTTVDAQLALDSTDPVTTITAGPSGPVASTAATFSFQSAEQDVSYECQLDAGAWVACGSPRQLSGLAQGAHTFHVRATDAAGNVESPGASRAWTVDTVAPETTVTSGPSGLTNQASPSFGFSSSEGASTFECRIDGGAWAGCTSPKAYGPLSETSHVFEVRATDAAGNLEPLPASRSFTVDVTAPSASITSAPPNPENSTSASFSFSSADGGVAFECQLDGGGFTACSSPKPYTGLSQGSHTFQVRATDVAGNTGPAQSHSWTVDTVAPDTTITSAPATPSNSANASLAFSSADGSATFQCRIDGAAFTSCSSPQAYTALSEGVHVFEVRASDAAGNVDATPDSHTWTVDTVPPDTTVTSGPSGPTSNASPSFGFSGSGGAVSFECLIDSTTWASCASPQAYVALSEASHTFQVRALDAAGNRDPVPATRSFTVDTTAPATTFGTGPASLTTSTSASLTFSSPDATASFECSLDGAVWAPCSSPDAHSGLADGAHTFQVRARDPAGNVDPSPASHAWTVDTTAPATTFGSGPPNRTNSTSASLTFSSPDGTASFECRIDGLTFTACSSPSGYSGLTDGSHTFDVRAKDPAGNVDPTPASYSWTVDTVAPNTQLDGGPASPTSATSASLSFSSPDSGAVFECSLDGVSFASCSSPHSYPGPLAEGSHTFLVRARDQAGNVDDTPAAHTWTIDTTPPETSIASGPADPTNSTVASFTFTGSGGAVSYECRLGAAQFVPCVSGVSYSPLAAGPHTFEVRARDAAGNLDQTPAAFTWTVDLTAPDTTVTAGPSGPTNNASPAFSFSSADGTASFECSLDGAAFAACASPRSYPSLAEGAHTFQVRAKDPAGNVDGSPASRSFTVDTTAPDTSLTGTPANPSNSASASLAFSSTDGTATFECRLDAAAWGACTSPSAQASLAEGAHTFQVRAKDPAGNLDGSPASFTWTVDLTAPDTTVTAGPSGATNNASPSFSFSSADATAVFECSLDGGTFASCASPKSYPSLAEGAHTFQVRARDLAGNIDGSPASRAFTVDLTAPATSLTSTPANPTNSASASFSFSSPDAGASFECSLDGGAYAACPSPKAYTSLAEGAHTFGVRAVDAANNADASPATFGWTVDLTAPDTSITASPPNPSGSASASFSFSSPDAGASFECSIDGGTFAACASPKAYPSLAEGAHSFAVRAKDPAGNVDGSPPAYGWTVDLTAPDTSISSGPAGPTNDPTPTFAFASPDGSATFECRLDGAAFAACVSPMTLPALTEGQHTFDVRAKDAAGNLDGSPASRVFTVDLTAPDTTLTSGPSGPVSSTSASFGFSSEAGATFECRLDGGAWGGCSSPKPYSGLGETAHTFEVRAKDQAGNLDGSPASRAFTVDVTAPDTSIDSAPANPTNLTTATLAFSSNEPGASFQCSLDAGLYTPCSAGLLYSGLAQGSHTVNVRAIDPAGNIDATPDVHTWTIDTTPPGTSITAAPANPTNSTAASFSFTSPDPAAGFECRLDGAAFGTCVPGVAYSALAQGPHTFEVRAKDPAGNVDPTPASHTWAIDTTAPDTSLTGTPANPSNSASASLAFSSGDGTASFECRLDGGAWAPCTSPSAQASLAEGSHTFEVRAKDPAGNLDGSPASFTWTVDLTAPDTTVSAGPSGPTNNASPSFSFSSADGTASFECRLDGGAWGACTSAKAYSSLAEGAHTFDVRAKDPAGNVDGSPASRAFTVDVTPPATTLTSGPGDPTNSTSANFAFDSPDASATFECRLDGASWAACTSPKPYSALTQGSHTFEVRAKDPAGNVDGSPASQTWTVDTTAPDTSLTSTPANPSNSASASLAFSSADGTASFECRLDGGSWAACASPKPYAALAEGSHTFEVRARDAAGNLDQTPAAFTWTVDLTAPDTTVTAGPSGPTNNASPSFSFSSADGTASFECRLDAGAWGACPSPKAYASLIEGAHTFEVRAKDPAGNVDGTPASRSFTVDTTAPDTSLTGTPANPSNSASASLAFSSTDGTATFECRLDAAAWGTCTSPSVQASLAEGAHTFQVRAKDPAGNLDGSPASFTWTVDLTAPDTSLTSGPSGLTNNASPSFGLASGDGSATFECRLDGGAWAACTSPKAYASLAEGAHTFEARAKDAAGNLDGSPASRSFTVDVTPPATTLTSTPPSNVSSTSASFSFSSPDGTATFECRLDNGAWAACTTPKPYASLNEGSHTFEVRAKDPAGNIDSSPSSHTWTVDVTAPDTSLTSGPSGLTNNASPSFGFSSADGTASFECRLDGGAWGACSSPKPYGSLAEGSHSFDVRAKDAAGNIDSSPAQRSFTVDITPPETSFTSGPNGGTAVAAPPTFTFTSPDGSAAFECRTDGGAWSACSSPRTLGSMADGSHTFDARAKDPAGNVDPTPAGRLFTLDTTAPETNAGAGPASPTSSTSASLSFSSPEPGAGFDCRLDGGSWAACSSPKAYTSLSEGAHTFEARAKDLLGNADASPATVVWTVDTTAPETEMGPEPPAIGMNVSPAFSFSSPDAGARLECRLDDQPFEPCASPKAYEGLTDGEHSFEARAVDQAGNADATAAKLSWFLDGTAPNTVIGGGPTGTSPLAGAAISFHSADFESSFECRLDGATWELCESPYVTGQLDPGIHVFRVRSRDAVGNVDATPAERGWKVDPEWTGAISAAGSARPHKTVALQPLDGVVGASFPLAAAVTAGSLSGTVDIKIEPADELLAGFTLLGRRIEISAPQATVDDPLVITLTVDPSLVPAGTGISDLSVLRDGVAAAPCSAGGATPDPCVAERVVVNGAMVLTVRSTHASIWHLGKADPPPPAPAPPATSSQIVVSPKSAGKGVTPAAKRCKVPRLRGMTLAAARKALTKAGCRLGTVQRRSQPSGKAGRVLTQKVAAGRNLRAGSRVGVVLIRRAQR